MITKSSKLIEIPLSQRNIGILIAGRYTWIETGLVDGTIKNVKKTFSQDYYPDCYTVGYWSLINLVSGQMSVFPHHQSLTNHLENLYTTANLLVHDGSGKKFSLNITLSAMSDPS